MIHSFDNRGDLPWPNAMLERGVIIGHTTPTTSRIWIRTGQTGIFNLMVFDRKKNGLAKKFTGIRFSEKKLKKANWLLLPRCTSLRQTKTAIIRRLWMSMD